MWLNIIKQNSITMIIKNKKSYEKGKSVGAIKGIIAIISLTLIIAGLIVPNPTGFILWLLAVGLGLTLKFIDNY